MTLAELRQEVIDRGYDYIKSSRIDKFLQRAYEEICSRYPWSFLEEAVTGQAPLEIADLRQVLAVLDTSNDTLLEGTTYRGLVNYFTDPTSTGTPESWYLDGNELKVYPVGTDDLLVRYIKKPAQLADSDTPLIPSEWQYLIVDRAVVDCLKDDDEYDEARTLRADVVGGVKEMKAAIGNRNSQNPGLILRTGMSGDYLA